MPEDDVVAALTTTFVASHLQDVLPRGSRDQWLGGSGFMKSRFFCFLVCVCVDVGFQASK